MSFTGSSDAGYLRLAAEFTFGPDFAGDAGHFPPEGVELIDHGGDGVLQFEDLAPSRPR